MQGRKIADLSHNHTDFVQAVQCRAYQHRMKKVWSKDNNVEEHIARSWQDSRGILANGIEEVGELARKARKVAIDAFVGHQSIVERRYSDSIAYFVWELKNRRADDPHVDKSMEDPIIPCVRQNN